MSKEPLSLDYFSGGVPASLMFKMSLDSLRALVKANPEREIRGAVEVCYISLTAYFEAFCKDLFASVLNIFPELTISLREAGQDTSLDAVNIRSMSDELEHRLGCLLAEKYDFGTAKKINALFSALAKITPFSKDESAEFDRIHRDRNLLVHHGGIFTTAYLRQMSSRHAELNQEVAFWGSLVMTPERFAEDSDFLESIGRKLTSSIVSALTKKQALLDTLNHKERDSAFRFLDDWKI